MKGIVFCEFIDFIESRFGEGVVDEMIESANPTSGAAYTTVGKYDWREMVDMVSALSRITSTAVPTLTRGFGQHLFSRLIDIYPQFLEKDQNSFEFLISVEDYIHVEVKKLYPDAELPKLDVRELGNNTLSIGYTSCRPFGDLCIGMLEGCANFFGEKFAFKHVAKKDGLQIDIVRAVSETPQ